MKKKMWVLGLTLGVLVIGIFVINYTKPITISELSQGIEITQYQSAKGEFNIAPAVEDSSFETNTQDELNDIFELFSNLTLKKSLASLVPQRSKSHRIEDGDFMWRIIFQGDEIILSDGNSITGDILTVSNFYGELEFRFDGESYICTTDNQEEWLKSVVDLLSYLELS